MSAPTSLNAFLKARSPVARSVTLVLSNGASVRLPVATDLGAAPRFASLDIFNHVLWAHKLETDASVEAAKDVLPDMKDFYSKFGGAKGRAAAAAGGKGRGGGR